MQLQFAESKIQFFAEQYDYPLSDREKELIDVIFPSYRRKRHLTREEFLKVCQWKTPRTKRHCEKNDETIVREISDLALRTKSERLRIQAWTLLDGVGWPTASVFLHFAFPDRYPILDYRALWSLNADVPGQYTFSFWQEYTEKCRKLAWQARVSMRTLDKALWQYSRENQKK